MFRFAIFAAACSAFAFGDGNAGPVTCGSIIKLKHKDTVRSHCYCSKPPNS